MSAKSKYQIFTREVKNVKNIPTLVLKEHKVKDQESVEKLVTTLKAKHEPYFEVHGLVKDIKFVYTMPRGVKNYTKKECRL